MKLIAGLLVLADLGQAMSPRPTKTTGVNCDGNELICERFTECCGIAQTDLTVKGNWWTQQVKVCYRKDERKI